ncbi:hypothetical protein VRRI112168_03570 [Vreelandella rituensis]|uniref:Uncharacterized protein n=1 Tax=Vreelandella rituensis TaxID=2282306 RepID=A0A368UBJ6_9GAMM|nr:hypothetical protein [Halomonas rituensis]RCV93732.1 hypothetical protein DU506_00840 [Halomonas rituensis]
MKLPKPASSEPLRDDSESKGWLMSTGSAFKGGIVGGVAAFALSALLFTQKPAEASATVLLPSLGTIITTVTSLYDLYVTYKQLWETLKSEGIDQDKLIAALAEHHEVFAIMHQANQDYAAYHAEGGDGMEVAARALLGDVMDDDGNIDPVKAAEYLLPPALEASGVMSADEMNVIRDHALMITQDKPLMQALEGDRDDIKGVLYEYGRMAILQNRFLAQDAITQYPMNGPRIAGYRKYVEEVQVATRDADLTPGKALANQLAVMSDVAIPVILDSLESDLRRERLLGAQLASLANYYYEKEGMRLAGRGQ